MEIASRRREQEVWQACDDLWALYGDLGSITGDAIRERLLVSGKSRGSPNEIYKYRKTWGQSRGINKEPQSPPQAESDPISRAVRMVHEKIQSEAQEHIDRLKQEFDTALEAKDGEITQVKEDLAALVNEYSTLQHDFSKLGQENKALLEQLSAEIEVRKSGEKELSIQKANYAQIVRSHEQILVELNKNQAIAIEHIKDAFNRVESSLRAQIEESEREKKRLGQEYSEDLNKVRLEKYTIETNSKELKARFEHLSETLISLEQTRENQEIKFKTVLEDCLKWQQSSQAHQVHLTYAQTELQLSAKQLKVSAREILKRDLLISRLRALIAHNKGVLAYGPAHQGAITRFTPSPHHDAKDELLPHSCT